VARHVGVALSTIQYWVRRARGRRLDRVDWSDHRCRSHPAAQRTPRLVEEQILAKRAWLRHRSVLGEYGARAIRQALAGEGVPVPALRTIGRVLERRGALDGPRRRRWPAPPPGRHLPAVAAHAVELDLFDVVEDLKLAHGPLVDVLTGISLHGALPAAWPVRRATTSAILPCLAAHWQQVGCPAFAQFDNDTRFQGPHQHRDVIGRVSRQCLQLGITPVFVPPRELGLQNAIEQFNGLFQAKVWRRFHFRSFASFVRHTDTYVAALRHQRVARSDGAPARPPCPEGWEFEPTRVVPGRLVYIRRTDEHGYVSVLGRRWLMDRTWSHRLVRVEIDLLGAQLQGYALRRRAPAEQPLLRGHAYEPRWR
jgi:hypothetical protein